MLAILDPWLLHVDEAAGIAPLHHDALADLVWMLSRRQIVIPKDPGYWQPLVSEFLPRFLRGVAGKHEPERRPFRAHQSRPTWADRLGHFWAEPAAQQATGKSYHWDVYLEDTSAESYGLPQLNIGRWRATFRRDGEPAPGALHHVPKGKESRLKKKTGWTC